MRMKPGRALPIALLMASLGCSAAPETVTDCAERAGLEPICGFTNPEDLALLPGRSWIAVSQFASADTAPGSLVAWRPADGRRLQLFPAPARSPRGEATRAWGAADCPGPPDPQRFSPHGIDVDLAKRRLAVVNHARESIELFRIGRASGGPTLSWRGCVAVPDGVWPNDVAWIDGGVMVTQMMAAGGAARVLDAVRLFLGLSTGRVFEWIPERGWSALAHSEGSAPNGIAVSEDGREVYYTEWAAQRLVRLRRTRAGEVERDAIDLPHHPDNLTWTDDGHLLVTGQVGGLGALLACGSIEAGTCGVPFSVLRVVPATLGAEVVLEHAGTAMGAASVALAVGSDLYIGTFAGDRLARARLQP